jgi:hypothetical protein
MVRTMSHDARTRSVPPDYQSRARELMQARGVAAAARELGLSTSALLRVVAGAEVMPGTLSLIREALGRPAV